MVRELRNAVEIVVLAALASSGMVACNNSAPSALEPDKQVVDNDHDSSDDLTYEVNGKPWDGKTDRSGKIWQILSK